MKLCPFCAEEIQDAAIRCKHCRSDLDDVELPPGAGAALPVGRRRWRWQRLAAGMVALLALAAVPVVGGGVARRLRSAPASGGACEPSSWPEWHDAMRAHCVDPAYVCEHMTSAQLLRDPSAVESFNRIGSQLQDVVGRVRQHYGCAPEPGSAFRPEPGPIAPPAFPPPSDEPRTI